MGQLTKNEIFALAVQRYSDTVFRAAMHNCSCTADAEDVVQDVFEKLLCYNGRFESEEHLKAWLLRVTINRCHDLTRTALNEAVSAAGGYMESSDESSYSGMGRSLSLTIRVPQDNYTSFLAAAAQAGNLVDKSEQVQDVTTQYMDIEARLSNLTAQRTRLQELQATAENLSDLLEIESSLSDVQYQLESWQSQLNWYSQQVECSTVYLSLSEVKEYTPTEESYLSQLSSALRNGWSGFVSGLQQLTVWVVGVWPLLTLMAAAALIVHLVRRRTRK